MPSITISTEVKVDGKKFQVAYTARKKSNQKFEDTAAGIVALFVAKLNEQKIEDSTDPIAIPVLPLASP